MTTASSNASRAALVMGHPGHELRVYHWLETVRPVVFVVTDGSGSTGRSRLPSTTALLERAGATRGAAPYGALSDGALYQALLDGQHDVFLTLAAQLADALEGHGIDTVVGDAVEGFNPGHDTCRLLINAAVAQVEKRRGRRIENFEFPLDSAPDLAAAGAGLRLELDTAALERKLEAARAYPEMAYEVDKALGRFGVAPFQVEHLTPVLYGLDISSRFSHPPYYETYGEGKVAAGVYTEVVRFRQHLQPLADALGAQVAAE